ncbi:MAG: hypothetical protein AMXMBFR61_05960 [Fimbriimonadales bacterium]
MPQVRVLAPSELQIEMDERRQTPKVTVGGETTYYDVHFARAYPFSDPERFIGAYDADGHEIGLIEDVGVLPETQAAIVRQDLARRYFTPSILAIKGLKQDATLWLFDVETTRGRCQFYVRHWRDNAYELSPGRWMITSVDGVRFEIPDWSALDERSKVLLEQLN